MGQTMGVDSMLNQALKSLCCSYGWSYGVFWRIDARNSMSLTLEDAYYEEPLMGLLIDQMLMQFHLLGEGNIGQAALTGKHQWISSDFDCRDWNPFGSLMTQDVYEGGLEFQCQLSSAIKTIAVIPLGSWGVVQFGSTKKIAESSAFLDQAKGLLCHVEHINCSPLAEDEMFSLSSKTSMPRGFISSSESPSNSSFTSWFPTISGESLMLDPNSQFQMTSSEDEVPSKSINSIPNLTANTCSMSTLSSQCSTLTSFESLFPTRITYQNTPDVLQWSASSPNDELTQAMGMTSVSASLDEDQVFNDTQIQHSTNPWQSSITNALGFDGKENAENVVGAATNLVNNFGLDCSSYLADECWNDITAPLKCGYPAVDTGIPECLSGMDVGSKDVPRKGLFSELGIEHLLEDVSSNANSVTKSSYEVQFFAKRRRTSDSFENCKQTLMESRKQAVSILDDIAKVGNQKDAYSKAGLWTDDSYGINAGSIVTSQTMQHEEEMKASRKRARPRESSRPRPKDRQLIQDRLKELKEIIPNSGKLSIDSLLDRTVKHMCFLQSVAKHADRLKQDDEPKLRGQENGVVMRENFNGCAAATWAFEVGGQTIVCPIIVEDLNLPGQMLIEMLCEEGQYFLEIADIIRGFSLTILKGVMKIQEDKLWARFTVEANENIKRMDILLSLANMLQQATIRGKRFTTDPCAVTGGGKNVTVDPSSVIDDGMALSNNYKHSMESLPVFLADSQR